MFPGNTAEIKTLIECVNEWKKLFSIGKVTFVGDRGMMSKGNLEALEANGMCFVVACPLKKLSQAHKALILEDKDYHAHAIDDQLSWIKEISLAPNRRLIVSYNSKRHAKDKKDRDRLIERIQKRLGKTKEGKKLVSNKGYLKYTHIDQQITA